MLLKDVLHIMADFGKEIGFNHIDLYVCLFDVENIDLEQKVKNLFLSRTIDQDIFKNILTDDGFVKLCIRIRERYLAPLGKHTSIYNALCGLIKGDKQLHSQEKNFSLPLTQIKLISSLNLSLFV